ncbi:MAG: hypothetical protein ACLFTA_03450 [Candidatus Nanohaloarchaea archaeon]
MIKARYPGGWIDAGLIAVVSWLTVVAALSILASIGIGSFEAIGVPT